MVQSTIKCKKPLNNVKSRNNEMRIVNTFFGTGRRSFRFGVSLAKLVVDVCCFGVVATDNAGLVPKLFVVDVERRMPLFDRGIGGLSFLCCFNASVTEINQLSNKTKK